MSQDSTSENSTAAKVTASPATLLKKLENAQLKTNLPSFRVGDSVKVHAKIREGGKERIQVFEGVVIRRHKGSHATATFTVRKISYNVGVERTFLLHSPSIEKIEVVSIGEVRRARLYYLRDLRGKSARIKSQLVGAGEERGTTSSSSSEENGSKKSASSSESASPAVEAGSAQ